jgi:hypothetical protein
VPGGGQAAELGGWQGPVRELLRFDPAMRAGMELPRGGGCSVADLCAHGPSTLKAFGQGYKGGWVAEQGFLNGRSFRPGAMATARADAGGSGWLAESRSKRPYRSTNKGFFNLYGQPQKAKKKYLTTGAACDDNSQPSSV